MPSEAATAFASALDKLIEERVEARLARFAEAVDHRVRQLADAHFEQLSRDTLKDGVLDVLRDNSSFLEDRIYDAINAEDWRGCSSKVRSAIEDIAKEVFDSAGGAVTKDEIEESVREYLRDATFSID